jgi:hypothetical protein
MSNLTLFQRLRLRRLTTVEDEHSRITFWLSGDREAYMLAKLLPFNEAVRRSYRGQGYHGFLPDADVVVDAQGVSVPSLSTLFWRSAAGRSESTDYASIQSDEAASGINVVSLNLQTLLVDTIRQIPQGKTSSGSSLFERTRRIISSPEFVELFTRNIATALSHEFAHIWQIQKSRLEQISEKNRRRFGAAIARYHKLDEAASLISRMCGVSAAKMGESRLGALSFALGRERGGIWVDAPDRILVDFFALIRRDMELLRLNFCAEGLSVFVSDYSNGKDVWNYPRPTVEEIASCRRMSETLVKGYKALVAMALKRPRDIEYYDRLHVQGTQLMMGINHELIGMKQLTYSIGPRIISLLWTSHTNIETIAKMDASQLIRAYERIAIKNGEMPLIAVSSGVRAHFNFTQVAAELNKTRHQLRGFTPGT